MYARPLRVRLAIVSDTHMPRGSRDVPGACAERLREADAILHCGDFIGAEVLRRLEALGPPLHAICGNVDEPALREALPARRVVAVAGARIGMIHDPGPRTGRLARLRRAFPDAEAVVFGHTHLPEHERLEDFQIFNPGSPTERRRAPAHTMGIATVQDGRLAFELVVVS